MRNNRKKNNKYGHFTEPEAEFDFHGIDPFLGEDGFADITEGVIKEFIAEGKKTIRIITGKGLNSKNGAVIKPVVMRKLQELKQRNIIRDFQYDTGGISGPNTGAFKVYLK